MDNTTIWGHFGQTMGIRPPGVSLYRVTPHCFVIYIEEIPPCFIMNVYLGYFALSKVPNKAIVWIIPIFGVILVKMWVFDPPGCPLPIYKVTPTVLPFISGNCHHAWP